MISFCINRKIQTFFKIVLRSHTYFLTYHIIIIIVQLLIFHKYFKTVPSYSFKYKTNEGTNTATMVVGIIGLSTSYKFQLKSESPSEK